MRLLGPFRGRGIHFREAFVYADVLQLVSVRFGRTLEQLELSGPPQQDFRQWQLRSLCRNRCAFLSCLCHSALVGSGQVAVERTSADFHCSYDPYK